MEAAGGLMLRAVIENARLIDHAGKIFRMPRRKTVMPTRLDVEQFVERVAVGQPGRAFLVGAKEVAVGVERHRNGEAYSCCDSLAMPPIGRKLLDGATFAVDVVKRFAGL